MAPYVINTNDTGIELDIVRKSLELKGHHIKVKYYPFARVPNTLKSGGIDAAITMKDAPKLPNIYYSNPHITYQNVAISLSQKNYVIENISDLTNKSIMAFQNANKFLGPKFHEMALNNSFYSEVANQKTQIKMLYTNRVAIIILDINIFKYYWLRELVINTKNPITIHSIFPPTEYKVGFRDSSLRDDFNEGLIQLKESGTYAEIIRQYTE